MIADFSKGGLYRYLIHRIVRRGIEASMTVRAIYSLTLYNAILLISLLGVSPFIFVNLFQHNYLLMVCNIILTGLMLLGLFWSTVRTKEQIFFILLIMAGLVYTFSAVMYDNGGQYFLISGIVLSLMFLNSLWRSVAIFCLFSILFVLFVWMHVAYPSLHPVSAFRQALNVITFLFILLTGGIWYKLMLRKEDLLAARIKRDHTSLKNTNQALYEQYSLVKEADESKRWLLSILSHDLRSPVSSLRGVLTLLQEDIITIEEARELMDEINVQIGVLEHQIENTLHWMLSQHGRINAQGRPLEVWRLADRVVSTLQQYMQKKQVVVAYGGMSKQQAFADENLLEVILRNLLTNAIKYSHEGGTVTVSTIDQPHFVVLSVRDEGTGMSKEEVEKLLNHGKPVVKRGTLKEKSHGMGMMMVKKFVEEMSGSMLIESEPMKGTTVSVRLPVAISL